MNKYFCRRIISWVIVGFSGVFVGGEAKAGDFIESAGTVLSVGLPAAAGVLTVTNDDGQGRWQLLESTAMTLGVTYGLKAVVDETRPNGRKHSFPSGHTSVSFMAADFMRQRYGWEYGIPAYAMASFVGYSRVEAKQHHVKDVLVGAAIGILSSELFTSPYGALKVSASAQGGSYGLQLSSCW
jgi:membrane-associated phospholipid phosphatase